MYSFLLGSQAFQAWFPSVKILVIPPIPYAFLCYFQNSPPHSRFHHILSHFQRIRAFLILPSGRRTMWRPGASGATIRPSIP